MSELIVRPLHRGTLLPRTANREPQIARCAARLGRGSPFHSIDRQHLACLNLIERFHCTCCARAKGLLAHASERAARTEPYFCPTGHPRRLVASHARSQRFLANGAAADFHARLEEFRLALQSETPT